MPPGGSSPVRASSPFACPVCQIGLGLPRSAAHVGPDQWPVALRCHRCGHQWALDRRALDPSAASPTASRWAPLSVTTTTVYPIAACRACAGLMTLDVALDLGQALMSSGYTCPHCGAAGEVSLPGAVVREAQAVRGSAAARAS